MSMQMRTWSSQAVACPSSHRWCETEVTFQTHLHLLPPPPKPTVFSLHSRRLFIIYYGPHTALCTIDSTLNKILSLSWNGSHSSRGEIKVIIMILSDKCLKRALWVQGEGTISSAWWEMAPRAELEVRCGRWWGFGWLALHQVTKVGRLPGQRHESKVRELEGTAWIDQFTDWEWTWLHSLEVVRREWKVPSPRAPRGQW